MHKPSILAAAVALAVFAVFAYVGVMFAWNGRGGGDDAGALIDFEKWLALSVAFGLYGLMGALFIDTAGTRSSSGLTPH